MAQTIASKSAVLSIVVPCYNEEEVIGQTHTRLCRLRESLQTHADLKAQGAAQNNDKTWELELLYVNDGSKDRTLSMLQEFADNNPFTKVVSFSRNFGHQAAIAAGLLHASGSWIATIDADLQDPPELIVDMLMLAQSRNLDVIHGKRKSRSGETLFKRLTAYLFYRFLHWLSRGRTLQDVGDFRLMSRRVVNTINSLSERSLYLRGLLPELGYRQEVFLYDRPERAAGQTKYTLTKMMALAFEGISAVSTAPLKLGLALGGATALICILYVLAIILVKILDPEFAVRGWPSLMVALLFLGAVQLLTIGILGEYVGQIHKEVKNRPRFFVEEKESRLGRSQRSH